MGEPATTIGPYRIIRKLGEGGMGVVFEAVHQTIERRVAIKFLHPEVSGSSEAAQRFIDEARAVNRISHLGLVQISDYGIAPDGRAYIVMEFLEGETLGSRMKLAPRMALAQAIYLARQIADALTAAHAKGIVHRDLKPENVMIIADSAMPSGERIKLLDFGLAKLSRSPEEAHLRTNSAALFGTPAYMSPEQCKGAGHVDAQTDVYSLGVMLFEMLSGRLPFLCQTPGEMISQHLFKKPPALAELVPDLPKAVTSLVDRLLLKEKQERPKMAHLIAAIDALNIPPPPPRPRSFSDTQSVAPDAPTGNHELGLSTLSRLSGQRPTRLWIRPRLLRFVALGAAALCLSLLTVHLLVRRSASPPPVDEPARGATPAAVASKIRLEIHSQPPGATVIRLSDGRVLGVTPWHHEQPPADGTLEAVLRLKGYSDRAVSLDLQANGSMRENLDAIAATKKQTPSRKEAAPAPVPIPQRKTSPGPAKSAHEMLPDE